MIVNDNIKPRPLTEAELADRKRGVFDSYANYIVFCGKCGRMQKTNMYVMRAEAYIDELNAAGKNLTTTRYCGVNATRLILAAMLVSGGLAGLLGAERVLGGFGYMQVNFSPGYGYDGITIAVIANNNPFGCLLMSLLMGLLRAGGTQLNIMSDVPSEWVDMLSAFIFIFVVAANAVMRRLPELRARRQSRERRTG